jgi:small conductance mechanosensitive channel
LLESPGNLSTEALNPEVVSSVLEERWAQLREWVERNAGRLLVKTVGVVLVLVLFGLLARLSRRLVGKILSTSKVTTTELLRRLFTGAASKLVWLLGFLIALSMIGVDVGPMLAGLGIAGFVLGFALQDTLSNFAAGMMIMFYSPFDVGDVVTAGGVTGKVESVNLVSTVIATFDNQVIIVPNSKVWGDVITNVTAQKTRRVDLKFGIGYGDDIPKAQRIMEDVLASHELVLDDPEPVVRVFELADSSVNFICRPWCRTEDYWTVYWDVTEAVKQRFDAEGVSIPFPQRDVHLYQQSGADEEGEG